jgi:hypothetical protein
MNTLELSNLLLCTEFGGLPHNHQLNIHVLKSATSNIVGTKGNNENF